MGQTALSESLRRVEAEIAAGQPEQALAHCQEIQLRYPRALVVQRTLGEIYLALRKPREALAALDRALAGNPEDARACGARAIVHQMHGDSLAALAWYRRACDIRPDDQVLRLTYRELAAHLGQPPYRPTRVGLARLYLRGDLHTHAIREWEALSIENPDLLEAQVGLAESLWRAYRLAEAQERCQRILANAPSCVKPVLILACIELDSGRRDEAARLCQRAAELDPAQQIAQVLFADRLAAGDTTLRTLLFGEEPAPQSRPAEVARRPVNRPLVTGPLVTGPLVTGPLREMPPLNEPPAIADAPTARMPSTAGPALSSARTTGLPSEFQSVFSETEYMLWGPDDDLNADPMTRDMSRSSVFERSRVEPFARSRVEPFARSAQFVPPALMEQGTNLDDTEARAAINWVHWLQAQGARVHEAAVVPPRPVVPPAAPEPQAPPRAEEPMPSGSSSGWAQYPYAPSPRAEEWQRGTGPLPPQPAAPPTPEALRAMFAELDPDAGAPRVVDADLVAASTEHFPATLPPRAESAAGEHDATGYGSQPEVAALWLDEAANDAGWIEEHALADGLAGLRDRAHDDDVSVAAERHQAHRESRESDLPGVQPPAEPAGHDAVLTIESLERGLAASGFDAVEPRPGMLATLPTATQADEEVPARTAHGAGLAPDDYAGRLALARELRGDGSLDDALVEYRGLLRSAPDLLPEVLSDVQESLAETPEHPELHRLLGDARIRQGDYLGALESYNRAVALTQAQES